MGEITLRCKFITPAFIYGNNDNAELRASSIKGLMRFWWRAVYSDFNNLEKMRNKESEIFGGESLEREKTVFRKSKVKVIVKGNLEENRDNNGKLSKMKEYKYMFYSMLYTEKNKKRTHFVTGTGFNIILKFLDKDEEVVIEYLKAINALQLFGGIGARSRRCGGNFVIEYINNSSNIDEKKILTNLYYEECGNDILNYYKKILKGTKCDKIPEYSNLMGKDAEVYLISKKDAHSGYKNNKEAIFKAGCKYKESRSTGRRMARGDSPLIIKIVREEKEFKILLCKLAGNFNEKEITIVKDLIESYKDDKDVNVIKIEG